MGGLLSAEAVRVGAVRGRYFRENFAQGGIDLMQIVPELVTNADAAIAAGGRGRGCIEVRFGAPDPSSLDAWRAQMRALRVPALLRWHYEVNCADDGIGVNAAAVDRRLGALGELPDQGGQRGLFGRGLRHDAPSRTVTIDSTAASLAAGASSSGTYRLAMKSLAPASCEPSCTLMFTLLFTPWPFSASGPAPNNNKSPGFPGLS